MTLEHSSHPEIRGKDKDNKPQTDLDRLRDYSRQFEGEFLQAEAYPRDEKSEDHGQFLDLSGWRG